MLAGADDSGVGQPEVSLADRASTLMGLASPEQKKGFRRDCILARVASDPKKIVDRFADFAMWWAIDFVPLRQRRGGVALAPYHLDFPGESRYVAARISAAPRGRRPKAYCEPPI